MYEINITNIFHFLTSFWQLIQGAMALDPDAFRTVQVRPSVGMLTWTVLILAGISETLGQCVVLFVNKVRPLRFIASLLLAGIVFALGAFSWMFTSWLIATYAFGVHESIITVIQVVCLAYAPQLFGFLILLPYMGPLIRRLLYAWSFLAMVVAISTITHLVLWQAFLCNLLGWAVVEALQRTIGRPIIALNKWIRQAAAGVPLAVQAQDLVKALTENMTDESGKNGGDKT